MNEFPEWIIVTQTTDTHRSWEEVVDIFCSILKISHAFFCQQKRHVFLLENSYEYFWAINIKCFCWMLDLETNNAISCSTTKCGCYSVPTICDRVDFEIVIHNVKCSLWILHDKTKIYGHGLFGPRIKDCRFMMVPGRHSIGELDVCGDSAAKNAINSRLYFMECQ